MGTTIDRPALAPVKAEEPVRAEQVPAAEAKPPGVEVPGDPKPAYEKPPFALLRERRVGWDPAANATAIRVLQRSADAGTLFRGLRLGALAEGEPFAEKLAAALEKITGTPISRGALEALYAACLPNTRVRLSASSSDQHGIFEYTVTWIDNTTEPIATLRRKLKRHDDGSLELYSHGCWVDPAHRNKAVSARVLQQEVTLLRTLSRHGSSRLSLWAGGVANPKKRSEQQSVGIYAWANFGFRFAAERTKLGLNTDRPRAPGDEGDRKARSDLEVLREQFGVFLDRLVGSGVLDAGDADLVAALRAASACWRQPWEIANLRVEGLRFEVPIGESKVACDLGKAFLLSSDAPRWEGVFLVNDTSSTGAAIGAAYTARSIAAAEEKRIAREAELLKALRSRSEETRSQAIAAIGAEGGPEWIDRLTKLAKRRPEHQEAIDTAVLQLRHEWTPPRPKIEYGTYSYSYSPSRFEVPREFADLEGLAPEQLSAEVRGDNFRRGAAALAVLGEKHAESSGDLVRTEAVAFFQRWNDEDRWQQRKMAVDVLGRLHGEAGIGALCELWKTEEDINVLIAFQRWLDGAETPVAEQPAHELGVRVEAMKEEIRIALEELANG